MSDERPQPQVKPLDPPMVPFAVAGIAIWAAVGLVVLLFFRDGNANVLWTCLAGFLLGFPGLAVMLRHDANRRRRRAADEAASEQPRVDQPWVD